MQRFVELVLSNDINQRILDRLDHLHAPDAWLVAGCLFQTVWNCLSDKPPGADILDYDIFYHDPTDLSWEGEDRHIRRTREVFADVDADIQIRNQARVHLWYAQKFGIPCPPLRSAMDGIDHFLNQSSCFGIRKQGNVVEVYAPFGHDDLFAMVVRPNPRRDLPEVYRRKAERWLQAWPSLSIVPWPATGGESSARHQSPGKKP
jgi:uncharacterized protein